MNRKLIYFTLMIALGAFVGTAQAENIQGSVVEVKPGENSFQILRTDTGADKQQNLNISVNEDTSFQGIDSIQSLRMGDSVMVDANKNLLTQQWTAKSISRGTSGLGGFAGNAQSAANDAANTARSGMNDAANTARSGMNDAGSAVGLETETAGGTGPGTSY